MKLTVQKAAFPKSKKSTKDNFGQIISGLIFTIAAFSSSCVERLFDLSNQVLRLSLLSVILCCIAKAAPPSALNQRVQANDTVNVRSSAGGAVSGTQSFGSKGTVDQGPQNVALGGTVYTWWRVNFDSGTDGWVASIGIDVIPSGTVDVQPLSVTRSPASVSPGGSLSVSWQIRNNGTATAGTSNSQVRISTSNSSSGGSGSNVGSAVATGNIAAGATINQNKTVTAPTTPGTYYVWVVADNNSALSQSNTSNDFAVSSSFTVTSPASVDVQPLNVTRSSSSLTPGASLTVNWQIRNNGTATAASSNSQVRITASGSSSGDSGDNAGSSVATGSINAGATINQSKTVTVPTTPGTYYAWVIADNNSALSQTNTSNDYAVSASFNVQIPPGPAPSISTVSPTSMPASNADQTLTINGSNFENGATLTFDPPTGSNLNSNAAKLTFVSSSKITYQINNGNDPGTWTVQVKNPDGQSSGTKSFNVVLGPAPTISSLSPSLMPGLNGNQTLTINGTNFVTGASLIFDPPTGTDINSNPDKLTVQSSTKIIYEINNEADAGTWTVKVRNPDGQNSPAKSFTVQHPPSAPGSFTLRNDAPYWDTKVPAGPAVMLRWDAATSATSYEVYRDGSKVFPSLGAAPYTGRTFLNSILLSPGGTHSFYILARNVVGTTQSNTLTLQMPTAPVGVPQIDSLTPGTVSGVPLPGRVAIAVRGSNFQTGVRAFVSYSEKSNVQIDPAFVQRHNTGSITVRVATSTDPDTWTLYLRNPDNRQSNSKTFQVTAPTGSITLGQINPPVVSPSAQARVFTLSGSGFSATDRVKLSTTSGTVFVTTPDIQFIGHQTLTFRRSFTQSPQTVTVRVVKASGVESEPVTLTVNQTLMPNLRVEPASIQVFQTNVAVGGSIDLSYTVQNVGNGPAPITTTRFRLSTDRRLTSTDPGFENLDWNIDAIPAQQSQTPPIIRLFIPRTLPPGQYHVGLFVDALGEANQSDETDDAAVSLQPITITATEAPQAPHFREHPKSQNLLTEKSFTLIAQASGARRYVWYFNGQPMQNPRTETDRTNKQTLSIFSPTRGNAGEYWVEAIGDNGQTALSNKAVIRFINSTPPDPSIEKGAFKLSALNNAAINPDLPTVILTHGWQPPHLSYDENSPGDFRSLAAKIRDALPRDRPANILLYAWEGAYRALPSLAENAVTYAGTSLANELQNYLESDYNTEIHFIGHSLGCFVSAVAIQKMSELGLFPNMPTADKRKVHLTVLDPAFGIGDWSPCMFHQTLKNQNLIAVVENYYTDDLSGTGAIITHAGPGDGGTKLITSEVGSKGFSHSGVWNNWYRGTIGSDSGELAKGGFNNSILLQDHRSQTGWNLLYAKHGWEADASCSPEPTNLQRMKIRIADASDVVGDLTKDGFNLAVDQLSGEVQEVQDTLNGILTKTKDLITSPFQRQAQQGKLAMQSMNSAATTSAREGLRLKSVLTIPAQAERIRILAKRIDAATDGVLAVLFAGVPLQIVGTDYFSAAEFRDLTVPIRHLRNRTGELELVLKRESGEEISLRIGSIDIENQSDVVAASSSLVVTKPAKAVRSTSTRVICQGRWRSKVPLKNLTIRVNQGAPIPLELQAGGGWQFEADGLLPGRNQLLLDGTTIHGQTISATREVWRVVTTPFQMAVVGEGLVRGVKLGSNTLEVGQELKLTTLPKAGHVFERWSGAHNGTSRTLNIRVGSGMSLTAHFIPSPFVRREGTYTAAITADDPALTGWLQIKLTTQGSFTGTWFIGSTSVPIRGVMDSRGRITLWNAATATELRLQLDLGSDVPTIHASLIRGAEAVAQAQAQRPAYDGRQRISPQEGRYTAAMESLNEIGLPQGYGYGTVNISKAGSVSLAARMPDRSSITQSRLLDSNGAWTVYARLYSKKGWVSGKLIHGDGLTTHDLSGTLAWVKPGTRGSYLPEAWSTKLAVIGSRFEKPAKGNLVLDGLALSGDNLSLTWQHGTSTISALQSGHLDVNHRFTPSSVSASLKLNVSNGLFSGSVLNPITNRKVAHSGVILKKQRLGFGLVHLAATTAPLLLQGYQEASQPVSIQVQIVPPGAASVTGQGNYAVGDLVRLQVTPTAGNSFVNWLENAAELSAQSQMTFVASSSRTLTAQLATPIASSFSDDFNRPNADEVGNGWLNSTTKVGQGWTGEGVVNSTLKIVNQTAQNTTTSGTAAIYRPFDHSKGVKVSALFNHLIGYGNLQRRFLHCIGVRSNGEIGNGLAVMFYRGDQNYNNSTVILFDGDTEIARQATSFQFTEWLSAEVEFRLDGSVQVHVANSDGLPGEQTLNFPTRTVNASGSNVIFVVNGCSDNLKAWVDNIEILQLPQ